MLLPGITNRCRPDSLPFCKNLKSCEARGGYWYNQSCHVDPEQLVCDTNHLDLCVTEQTCRIAGGYWYELSCHPDQSPNFIKTKKLAGDWYFSMSPAVGANFVRLYNLNINTVKEDPAGSGEFTIRGTDMTNLSGDPVTGGYVSKNDNYTMFVTKTASDVLYEFTFTSGTNDVSGCYYDVDKKDGTPGSCIPMVGTPL